MERSALTKAVQNSTIQRWVSVLVAEKGKVESIPMVESIPLCILLRSQEDTV
jgi:hypothetical protein